MDTINARVAGMLLSICALAACNVPRPVPPPVPPMVVVPPPAPLSVAEQVSRYAASLQAMTDSDLAGEYETVNRRFRQTGDPLDRFRLAILLTLPDTPFHNTAAARALLKNADETDDARRDFAHLLDVLLAGQQRAEAATDELNQSLAAEKARSKSLQGKIDAIKELEINPKGKAQP